MASQKARKGDFETIFYIFVGREEFGKHWRNVFKAYLRAKIIFTGNNYSTYLLKQPPRMLFPASVNAVMTFQKGASLYRSTQLIPFKEKDVPCKSILFSD